MQGWVVSKYVRAKATQKKHTLFDNNQKNGKILKVGVLLPLSGKFQDIGESFLKAIQLALYDISNKNIKIYPKDSKGNALDAYQASKEFEKENINIVIGPIFYESLERLNEIKLSELLNIFYDKKKANARHPKRLKYEVEHIKRLPIANLYLSQLSSSVLAEFRDKKLDEGKAPSTVNLSLIHI